MGVNDAQMCPRRIECVLNFKPVTLIDAFRLDEAQVTQCPTFGRVSTIPYERNKLLGCVFAFLVCACLRGSLSVWCLVFLVSFIRLLSVSIHQYIQCTFGFVTDGNCPKARR